jgi:Protein of unknown function (DUF2911)
MTKTLFTAIAFAALAGAQAPPGPRASPHATISTTLDGKEIKIEYGRPYLKGRPMDQLAPTDKVWRLGADEATKLTTAADIKIGNMPVPKGSYALFAIPGESKWILIVNKTADQWGAFSYDSGQDLGRVDMHVSKTSAPVEQFTMSLSGSGKSGTLKLMWGNVAADVQIVVQ